MAEMLWQQDIYSDKFHDVGVISLGTQIVQKATFFKEKLRTFLMIFNLIDNVEI